MDLTTVPWAQAGWGGIVVLVVLLIIRGDLVPARYYRQVIEDNKVLREANNTLQAQNAALVSAVQLPVNAMTAIEQRANATHDEGATT